MLRRRFNSKYRNNGNSRFGFHGRKLPVYDPNLFIKKAAELLVEEFKPVNQFTDFNIHPILKRNIINKGYTSPTPIQDSVIPVILEGRDVVGIAATGTGKTAAFLIPLINKILLNPREKVLIIAPTRELAIQIREDLVGFAGGMRLESVIAIGGVGIVGQIQKLRRNPNVVIGTPGRIRDLEERRAINLVSFRSIVLDEVDRMLDMGFIKDTTYIVSKLSYTRHSLFFSATLPDRVQSVMRQFSKNPEIISVKKEPTSLNVSQDVVRLNGRDKIDVLDELLNDRAFRKVLVFGRTKRGIDKIEQALTRRHVTVAAIHGNKSQNQRQKALDLFKASRVQVLLATDIASRGLDINDITHVVNFDLPETYEDYIHRIGRTGRANKKGIALTFV